MLAKRGKTLLSLATDLGITLTLGGLGVLIFYPESIYLLRPSVATLYLTLALAAFVLTRLAAQMGGFSTPGEWLYGIKSKESERWPESLKDILFPANFTAVIWVTIALAAQSSITGNPLFLPGKSWILTEAESTDPTLAARRFVAFYTAGYWPTRYQGKPVLHTLPYAKGPPERFIPMIQAKWQAMGGDESTVSFEGPKTHTDRTVPVAKFEACFGRKLWHSLQCIKLREETLSRPISEMSLATAPTKWEMRWFETRTPDGPSGVYIAAIGSKRTEERYIVISAKESHNITHQALILNRPTQGRDALASHRAFRSAVANLQILPDLKTGREMVTHELAKIKLTGKPDELLNAQRLLLSKLSVEPRDFEAYFHSSGTSVMLLRSLTQSRNAIEHSTSTIKPLSKMAQDVHAYARDVSPKDARVSQLEVLSYEAKKY